MKVEAGHGDEDSLKDLLDSFRYRGYKSNLPRHQQKVREGEATAKQKPLLIHASAQLAAVPCAAWPAGIN